jgi:hypothetical protein
MENMHDLALEENERLEIKLAESLMATESLRREVNEMREEHRSRERESHALRSQAADLSRQLALTLNEVHELKGSPAIAVPEPSPASSQQSVSDIITSRLVDFRDIAELQQKNQEMLFVIRELSEKNEHEQVDAKKEYEVKLAELREETEKQLLELKTRRDEQESVVKSIARQRDLYKSLYARATGENVNDAMDVGISPSGGGQMVLASAGASPNVKSGALVLHGGGNQEENNMQIVALSKLNESSATREKKSTLCWRNSKSFANAPRTIARRQSKPRRRWNAKSTTPIAGCANAKNLEKLWMIFRERNKRWRKQ